MPELLAPHWVIGSALAICGALVYRFGARILHTQNVALPLAALAAIALGLFVVMRGVSRAAQRRGSTGDFLTRGRSRQ